MKTQEIITKTEVRAALRYIRERHTIARHRARAAEKSKAGLHSIGYEEGLVTGYAIAQEQLELLLKPTI